MRDESKAEEEERRPWLGEGRQWPAAGRTTISRMLGRQLAGGRPARLPRARALTTGGGDSLGGG